MVGMTFPEPPAPASQPPAGPPPHPFASPQRPAGRGLSISAMAIGLVALLTAVVSAVYFGAFLVLAGILGATAVVLGVIALVLRQPKAPGLLGLVAGALSIVIALAMGVVALVALVVPDGDASGSGSGSGSDPAVLWPANMETGGIVFTEGDGEAPAVVESPPRGEGDAPVIAQADGDRVIVYVDYRCPACAAFEGANAATLEDLAASGSADVEIRPLRFLDRYSEGSYYSSRASAAMACIVDAEPERAWAAHAFLLGSSFQPPENTPGHDNATLIDALDGATGGLGEATKACIGDETFVPFAQALDVWAFSNPVPEASDPETAVTGTPFVLVNGEPYAGGVGDAEAFRAFLAAQGVKLS